MTILEDNHTSVLSYGDNYFAKINIERRGSWLARPQENPEWKWHLRHQRLADTKRIESVQYIAIAAFRVNSRNFFYGTSKQDC